jgi:hypothetical protein
MKQDRLRRRFPLVLGAALLLTACGNGQDESLESSSGALGSGWTSGTLPVANVQSVLLGKDGQPSAVIVGKGEGELATLRGIDGDGKTRWEVPLGRAVKASRPIVGKDGTIYVIARDSTQASAATKAGNGFNDERTLVAVAPTGAIQWSLDLGHGENDQRDQIAVSPLNGDVYVNGSANFTEWKVNAVHPDGSLAWTFPGTVGGEGVGPNGTIFVTPDGAPHGVQALAPDGVVLFSALDGKYVNAPIAASDGTAWAKATDVMLHVDSKGATISSFIVQTDAELLRGSANGSVFLWHGGVIASISLHGERQWDMAVTQRPLLAHGSVFVARDNYVSKEVCAVDEATGQTGACVRGSLPPTPMADAADSVFGVLRGADGLSQGLVEWHLPR